MASPLSLLNDNQQKTAKVTISNQNESILFQQIIPYEKELINEQKMNEIYPFLSKPEKRLNLWRTHFIVSLIINALCVLDTVIHLWFIIYAPSPYRWISLFFFIFAQLVSVGFLVITAYQIDAMEPSNILFIVISIILFPAIPLIPGIATQMIIQRTTEKERDEFDNMLESTLWIKCICSGFIACFQAFPQLILLTIMSFTSGDVSLNWTFMIDLLTILAFSTVAASIYEEISIYILNVVWLWLDYMIFLFMVCVAFYDSNAFILFIVDMCITIFPFIFAAGFICLGYAYDPEGGPLWKAFIVFCLMMIILIILTPFIILTIGPWTLFVITFFSQFWDCNVYPFCLNFPFKDETGFTSYWHKYRVFKWIKNGYDTEDKDIRLCCVNMIILDKYYQNEDQFGELTQIMSRNIRQTVYFGRKCTNLVQKSNHSKYKLNFKVVRDEEDDSDLDTWDKWIVPSFHLLFLCRVIHIVMPLIVGAYIVSQGKWTGNITNVMMKYLGYITIVLYAVCMICFCLNWKLNQYHRMIIPFKNFKTIQTDDFDECMQDIAKCHTILMTERILTDWIGNRDIAYIIFQYV